MDMAEQGQETLEGYRMVIVLFGTQMREDPELAD
jgi:hypothetical protein